MSKNANLRKADREKNDEFYTQLSDIDNELKYYKEHFKGKTVFCNCDDPYESNFFKYFASNFNFLGLKKLIATGYSTSPIAYTQLPLFEISGYEGQPNRAYKIEINEVYDANGDGAINLADVEYLLKSGKGKNKLTLLKGDGDFRSEESIKLLKQSDIVVTNPPFSIAREYYIPQLFDYDKKFLIIGDLNWITYKTIFPLLKDNKMWIGYTNIKGFIQPSGGIKKFGNKLWFTNLDIKKRHEELILYKKYNLIDYSMFDDYNAININKVNDIPCDYDGLMGVPITFFDKYNPKQFEIIDEIGRYSMLTGPTEETKGKYLSQVNGKPIFARIIIRRKK